MNARGTLLVLIGLLATGCGSSEGRADDVPTDPGPAAETSEAEMSVDETSEPTPDVPGLDAAEALESTGHDAEPTDLPFDAPEEVSTTPCPAEMAWVDQAFCIDRWEAALEEHAADGTWEAAPPWQTIGSRTVRAVAVEGRVPQAYLSALEAEAACAASGKRLCTSDEWLQACRGPAQATYPYGDAHVDGACNDDYPGHPVVDYFGSSEGVWDDEHLNDPGIDQMPGTVAPAGAHPQCVSAWGVADLHGNLHEWVADVDGTFRGGFYADGAVNGPGCLYVTTAHDAAYHDYSTGFRCCRTP